AAYEVLLAQSRKPWVSLLGPVFLSLTPRLVGALPADPKDGPFAVLYFTSLTAVFLMARRPISPWFKVPALGLLFGLTTAQRLVGFTLFLVWPLYEWILWRWGLKPKARRKGSGARPILIYAGVFFISQLILAATWPYLAADYFHRLPELLKAAKDYPWNDPVLFLGREIPASGLPRTYLPVFLLVTTPLLALFWFAASFRALRKPQADPLWALLGLALGLNLALYLILKPVVYDGLRHFLFLLPLTAVMAACGLANLLARPRAPGRRPLLALSALLGILALADMARLHPYEYVYFNELTGGLKGAQGRFETDYWGASYKEAVDWVQAQEPPGDTPLWVHSNGNPYQVACYLNDRTHWTDDLGKADYYLATTRDGANLSVDPARRVHRVEREGVPLCDVFKLK
ncbi:MAG TPA: hypothetical protein VFR02_00255, partial [bacterium]|nr:hypothetical protein [bacterium]